MAFRRGTSVARSKAPKRQVIWVGTAAQGDVAIGSGLSVIMSSFAPDDLGILKATVVRVRGIIQVIPTFGVDGDYAGAFGLGVVSDEAFVAGAGSIPRPFDDDDWSGWLVHGYYAGHVEFASGVGELMTNVSLEIDSKAMRKVGPGQTLVWMVESSEGAVRVFLHARVLMKLS